MHDKEKEIYKYSNPKIVFTKARKLFNEDVEIALSSRKEKKYMIFDNDSNRWVHFGQMGYEDYTKHKDKLRRLRFRERNKKWFNANKFTPAFLSYHLLW